MTVRSYHELVNHVGHALECVESCAGTNVAVVCIECSEVLVNFEAISPGRPALARPTCADLQTTVGSLDWLLTVIGELDRRDLQEPIRVARAFVQATLDAS
jgi:hypothetical protein